MCGVSFREINAGYVTRRNTALATYHLCFLERSSCPWPQGFSLWSLTSAPVVIFIFRPWVDNPDQWTVPSAECAGMPSWCSFSVFPLICVLSLWLKILKGQRRSLQLIFFFFISHKVSSKESMKNSTRHSGFRQLSLVSLVLRLQSMECKELDMTEPLGTHAPLLISSVTFPPKPQEFVPVYYLRV